MESTYLKQSKINFLKRLIILSEILTDEALTFITALHEKFNAEDYLF
jgi:malate synthase